MSRVHLPIIPTKCGATSSQSLVRRGFGSLGTFPYDFPHTSTVYTHARMSRIYILPNSQSIKKTRKNRVLKNLLSLPAVQSREV